MDRLKTCRSGAETLSDNGLAVECAPVGGVQSSDERGGCIGSALYMSRLRKDARHFSTPHHNAMMKLRVALFMRGPVHQDLGDFGTGGRVFGKDVVSHSAVANVIPVHHNSRISV